MRLARNLRLLISLWDEGGGSPWQPFYRGAKRWPVSQGWWSGGHPSGRAATHVAKASPFCPKGVVVELKSEIVEGKGGQEGEGGRPATNLWATGHAWPPLNPYFHLVPLMLTPLTKSIRSKVNSFYLFP
jgi:hypothetical protein